MYRPVEVRRRGVGVSRRIGRPHLEVVATDREPIERRRTRTARKSSIVDVALKGATRLIRRKRERCRGTGRHRPRISRDAGVGRRGIDSPGVQGDGPDVSCRIDGPHAEVAIAVGQPGQIDRARAGREGGSVQAALESRRGVVRRKG